MSSRGFSGLGGFWAGDAECENCGRTRRYRRHELRAYEGMGHTVESFGRKLICNVCRERGAAHRNISLVMRPVDVQKRSA